MPATATRNDRPAFTIRRVWGTALPLLVPPFVWIASLGLSWAVQDFTCTAAITAGAPVPATALLTTLLVMNAVLFAIAVISALYSVRIFRQGRRDGSALLRFVGVTGVLLAAYFGLGIVAIGSTPLVLEIC